MGSALSNIDQSDYSGPDEATQLNANYTLIPEMVGWALNIWLAGVVCAWLPSASYLVACLRSIYASTASVYVINAKRRHDKWHLRVIGVTASVLAIAAGVCGLAALIIHGSDQVRSNDEISLVITPDSITSTFAALVAALVQCFYTSRCYVILPRWAKWPFVVAIVLLALGGLTGGIGFSIVCLINHGSSDVTRGAGPDTANQLFILAMLWLWCDATADLLISGLLCARLLFMRKRGNNMTGVSVEDAKAISPVYSWIGELCKLTLGTALVTSITAMASAITFITTYTTTNLALVFTNLLPGLYALSCLWVLSSRHRFLSELNDRAAADSQQIVWDIKTSGPDPRFEVRLAAIEPASEKKINGTTFASIHFDRSAQLSSRGSTVA